VRHSAAKSRQSGNFFPASILRCVHSTAQARIRSRGARGSAGGGCDVSGGAMSGKAREAGAGGLGGGGAAGIDDEGVGAAGGRGAAGLPVGGVLRAAGLAGAADGAGFAPDAAGAVFCGGALCAAAPLVDARQTARSAQTVSRRCPRRRRGTGAALARERARDDVSIGCARKRQGLPRRPAPGRRAVAHSLMPQKRVAPNCRESPIRAAAQRAGVGRGASRYAAARSASANSGRKPAIVSYGMRRSNSSARGSFRMNACGASSAVSKSM